MEWIEFHREVGVEKFYLFDNLTTEPYEKVLQPYIDQKIVEITLWPIATRSMQEWNEIQCLAYERVIHHVKGVVKWLALIDTDEYLFSVTHHRLTDALQEYEPFAGVAINWQVYGTSNIGKIPLDELTIEHLTYKIRTDAEVNRHVKSIVRPERILKLENPHSPIYLPGYFQVDTDKNSFEGPFSPSVLTDKFRINHYMVRDEQYLREVKIPRRTKLGSLPHYYDRLNEVEDKAIQRFIPFLRDRMSR